jgi:hypothetical protein
LHSLALLSFLLHHLLLFLLLHLQGKREVCLEGKGQEEVLCWVRTPGLIAAFFFRM